MKSKSNDDIAHRFGYHPPLSDNVVMTHEYVRGCMLALAECIDGVLPFSREKSLAMTKIEEAMMWANAAIARNQGGLIRVFKRESESVAPRTPYVTPYGDDTSSSPGDQK